MADKKISQLNAAATPLAGTEVLPIVQSGATVKVSVANLTAGRTVTATDISAGLGTVSTPSYTFTGDTNTGIFSPAADTLAFVEGGVEALRITSAANIGVGTPTPVAKLDVNGTGYFNSSVQFFPQDGFRFTSVSAVSAMRFGSAATGESTAEWAYSRPSAAAILSIGNTGSTLTELMRVLSNGRVGINESAPDYRLDVNGTFGFTPGSSVTPVDNGDVVFELTNNTTLTIKARGSDGVVRSVALTLA